MFKTAVFLSLIGWFVFPGRAGTVNGITLENFTGLPLASLDGGRMNPVGRTVASENPSLDRCLTGWSRHQSIPGQFNAWT